MNHVESNMESISIVLKTGNNNNNTLNTLHIKEVERVKVSILVSGLNDFA